MTRPVDFELRSTQTVGARVVSNTGWLLGAKALAAIIGLIALIITERALDNQIEFGTVIFLHAYMLFFAEVATFQTWQSIIRFGADNVRNRDERSFGSLIKFGITLDALSALAAFLSGVLLFWVFAAVISANPWLWTGSSEIELGQLRDLTFVYLTVVLFQQTGTSQGILRVFDKFKGLALAALLMPILRVIGVCFAYYQGWGLIGFVAVWYVSSLLRYVFMIALGVIEVWRRGLWPAVRAAKAHFRRPRQGLWPFVWKSNIDSTLAAGASQLPLMLVMLAFGPAIVAVYRIAEEIARLLSEGMKLIDQVIYPELARIMAQGEGARIWRLVTKASLAAGAIGLVLSILVAVFGPSIINRSLGEEYALVVPLSILLVFGAALFGAVAPLYPVFYAAYRPGRAIWARLAGIVAYLIAFVLLTSRFGIIGAASAVVIGYFVGLCCVALLAKRTLKLAIAENKSDQDGELPMQTVLADRAIEQKQADISDQPVLAIFDLDYTITQRGTWGRFVWACVRGRPWFWLPLLFSTLSFQLDYKMGRRPRGAVKKTMMRWSLQSRPQAELMRRAEIFVAKDIQQGLRPGAVEALAYHKARGDHILIATAAVDLIAKPFGDCLKVDGVVSTVLSWDGDQLSNDFESPNCYGEAKRAAVDAYIHEHNLADLKTVFYTDSTGDLPLLEAVDIGIVVDPSPNFRKHPKMSNFPIQNWRGSKAAFLSPV